MRVLFFTPSLSVSGGGSHQNAMTLIRALRKEGAEVNVHVIYSEGSEPADISVHVEPGSRTSFLGQQRTAATVLKRRESEADIFLIYGQSLMWAAGLYRFLGGEKPVVVYLDSHLDSMKEAYRGIGFFQRLKHLLWGKTFGLVLARSIDAYAAVSPYVIERYVRFGFPRRNFSLVPNAFEFSDAPRSREYNDALRLLYVGRLSHEKGVDFLLETISGHPWRLQFIGDGPERASLIEKVRSMNAADRIKFSTWQSQKELADAYASADVLVLPSRVSEPFGRVVAEAMYMGLPVIVPEKGGAAWVAGDAGVTFKNGDTSSLRAAIESLENVERRDVLGRKGRIRAEEFSAESVAKQLMRLLESAIGRGREPFLSGMRMKGMLRIIRFLIAGGLATFTNLLTLYALVHIAELWYLPSSIIAFFAGFVVSFTLQKFWTFGDRRTDVVGRQLAVYFGIVLFNLALNTGLVYVLVEFAGLPPLLAQAIAALTIAIEGYFAYKVFVFKRS